MSTKKPLTASKLRLILSVSLFVITIGAGAIFYLANHTLHGYASDVSTALAEANSSQDSLQILQQTEKQLQTDKDAVTRAAQIVADSKSYQYQDQIITDLKDYAAHAGVTITNLDFSGDSAAGSSPSPSTSPSGTAKAAPSIGGVKSTFVSVTLQNPVDYDNLLKFMHSIEQNLTKMQISSVNLSKDETNPNRVTSNVLTLEVYIR